MTKPEINITLNKANIDILTVTRTKTKKLWKTRKKYQTIYLSLQKIG